jgi:hypothetical protein
VKHPEELDVLEFFPFQWVNQPTNQPTNQLSEHKNSPSFFSFPTLGATIHSRVAEKDVGLYLFFFFTSFTYIRVN